MRLISNFIMGGINPFLLVRERAVVSICMICLYGSNSRISDMRRVGVGVSEGVLAECGTTISQVQ